MVQAPWKNDSAGKKFTEKTDTSPESKEKRKNQLIHVNRNFKYAKSTATLCSCGLLCFDAVREIHFERVGIFFAPEVKKTSRKPKRKKKKQFCESLCMSWSEETRIHLLMCGCKLQINFKPFSVRM